MKNLFVEILGVIGRFYVKIIISFMGMFALIPGLDSGTSLLQFALCSILFFFILWKKLFPVEKLTLIESIFVFLPIIILSSLTQIFAFRWILFILVTAVTIMLIAHQFFKFEFDRRVLIYCSRNRYPILLSFVLLSFMPLNLFDETVGRELASHSLNSKKLVENCNIAAEYQASFILMKCGIRLIFDKQSNADDKNLGLEFADKALELSRAKKYLSTLETYYATSAACLNMYVGRKAYAMAIAQKFNLKKEQSKFAQDQNCKNN